MRRAHNDVPLGRNHEMKNRNEQPEDDDDAAPGEKSARDERRGH